MASVDDLLLDLMDRATPATDDDYLVYADAASSCGDPRGELVVIQHALARHELTPVQRDELRAREAELLERDELFGDLAQLFARGAASPDVRWHNGFIRTLVLRDCRLMRADPTLDYDVTPHDALRALLEHPSTALLEELALGTDTSQGTSELSPGNISRAFGWAECELLASHWPYCLRRLRLNDRWSDWTPREDGKPAYYDISWFKVAGMKFLSTGVRQLEHLELISGDFMDLEELDLPELRTLALRTGGLRPDRLRALCDRPHPSVERLEVWFGRPDYGGDCSASDILPLLDRSVFPNLRWLGLMNAEFADDLVEPLGRSAVLPQLEGLSLALGCLTRVGMRQLIGDAGAYAHLREFDVSWSMLDVPSQRALENGIPGTIIGTQRAGTMRYATVGE